MARGTPVHSQAVPRQVGPDTRPAGDIKANYIACVGMDNGEDAVLKVGVPHDDFSAEMEALAIYQFVTSE